MKGKWIDFSLISLFIVISSLTLSGTLHFGTGLGDILYILIAAGTALIYSLMLLIFRKSVRTNFLIVRIFFGLILLYLIYSFTIGRGAESHWNGTIFF